MKLQKVAILGATGAVGQELIQILEQRNFPVEELRLLASSRSAGREIAFKDQNLTVEPVAPHSFQGVNYAFFSAGASRSREFAPIAVSNGATVIDNSSAFRMDSNTPLIIPEINGDELTPSAEIIAVPNCSAIVLLMAIAPLRQIGKIERLIVSTYQSASGGGAALMKDLQDQTADVIQGGVADPKVSPYPYAFNLFSHNTTINAYGYNEEEWKVIEESRKILGMEALKINVTCVRVPVLRAHTETITVEFSDAAPSEQQVRDALDKAPGVILVDNREGNHFPMPIEASGMDDVLVGRIRRDLSNPKAICLMASGDQLRKGAALNAVQIAERLLSIRDAYVSTGTVSQSSP